MGSLVSVIIPIYNVSEYLDRCIESACSQTYCDIEIILVDDGSTDTCPEKCDSWKRKDNRIKVIHKVNGGLSSARNAGLDIAQGKYVYFLDGDDYIEQDLLETVVPILEQGADLVVFRFFREFSNGVIKSSNSRIGELVFSTDEERLDFITEHFMAYDYCWEAWNRIFVRKIIEDNEIRFEDNRRIFAEDLYFSLCYLVYVTKLISIPQCLHHYLIRENSIMARNYGFLNFHRFNELGYTVNQYYQKHKKNLFEDNFYKIYFLLFYHQRQEIWSSISGKKWKAKKILLNKVCNKAFMKKMLRQVCDSDWKPSGIEEIFMQENLNLCRYLIDGSYILYCFRNRRMYKRLSTNNLRQNHNNFQDLNGAEDQDQKTKIYVLGTEEFGNIGDHQINETTYKFLAEAFPEAKIIEVTIKQYDKSKELLKKVIKKDDVIILPGGGNFGDVYPNTQRVKDDIVSIWKDNIKIVFPQTVYFSKTHEGETWKAKAEKLYSNDNNIILITREKYSYALAKQLFSCEVLECPDIVLRYPISHGICREDKILWCMRNDVERTLSDSEELFIFESLKTQGFHITKFDLQLPGEVSIEDRNWLTEYALKQFESSRLVITDRLHGMIFAAVTGTPCIVLSNYNYKIHGSYEWIKYLPYIRYADTAEEAVSLTGELYQMEKCSYDNSVLLPHYEELKEIVKRYVHD